MTKDKEIERFNPACQYHETEGYPFAYMAGNPNGEYVRYEEIEQLRARVAELQQKLQVYGEHRASCATGYSNAECDCGLVDKAAPQQEQEG